MTSIEELFTELYKNNKYLIKIKNKTHNNWTIYIYKNEHIKIDIDEPISLTSYKINIEQMINYINEDNSDIKISYNYHYDDYKEYIDNINDLIEKIKNNYENKKNIIIRRRVY